MNTRILLLAACLLGVPLSAQVTYDRILRAEKPADLPVQAPTTTARTGPKGSKVQCPGSLRRIRMNSESHRTWPVRRTRGLEWSSGAEIPVIDRAKPHAARAGGF
jgi:hypothetical protein